MMADKLGDYIVGTAVETIETEKLIKEFEHVIVDDVYGTETPIEKVTKELQERLHDKGLKINTITVDNIYNETSETRANTNIWYSSKNIADARPQVSQVCIYLYTLAFFVSILLQIVTYAPNAGMLCFQSEHARCFVHATSH